MSEPRTEAGKRLLADLRAMSSVLDFPINGGADAEPYGVERTRDGIAEIEAEMQEAARADRLDVERLARAMDIGRWEIRSEHFKALMREGAATVAAKYAALPPDDE